MVSPRSYFARMNENRGDNNWLTEDQLLEGTKEFFKSNDYSNMEYNKTLNQGGRTFSSPIVATKTTLYNENQKIIDMIVTIMSTINCDHASYYVSSIVNACLEHIPPEKIAFIVYIEFLLVLLIYKGGTTVNSNIIFFID